MRETGIAPDLGWRLQCELLWIDRLSPRGKVVDLTVINTSTDAWRCADTNFVMTSKKLDARRVQVLDYNWFKTDHRADSSKLGVNFCGWTTLGKERKIGM